MANYGPPIMDFGWLGQIGDTLGKALKDERDTRAILSAYDQTQSGGGLPALGQGTAAPAAPRQTLANLGSPNEVESRFIDTVRGAGLTNPNGLGAVAAYGKAESGYSPQNVNRTWSDPSESGQAGTSGGIMSWRAERLQGLQNFAKERGEAQPSVETQALYLAKENPQLIPALQAAKSPQEANQIMANAWRFAGYNRPGGENARREALTAQYAGRFGRTAQADAPAPGASEASMPGSGAGFAIPGEIRPMSGSAFNAISSGEAQQPVFQSEGILQPWMGTALNRDQAPQPQAVATLPPPRPYDLRSDMPARGALATLGQAVAPPVPPDLSNQNDAGSRYFASGQPELTAAPPPQMAQADIPAPGATEAQGFAVPGTPQPATRQNVNGNMIRTLLANPGTRDIGKQLWAQTLGGKSYGFQVVGDQLYRTNPQTGTVEPMGVTNPKAALDMQSQRLDIQKKERELQGEGAQPLTAEERTAIGIPEGQAAYKTRTGEIKFGPAGTKITNAPVFDTKGESKFNETLGASQAKRWDGYIAEGDQAQTRIADIQTLRETSRRLGSQGSQANMKSLIGPYAESLGIKVDGLSDIQLYESITNRLAPQLRAPGSGSTSDIEFKGFMRAIGPLSNTPAAREMILDTFEAASRNDLARSEIATRLASGEIGRGQAEKELRSLPNPMEGYKKFREANPDLVGNAIKDGARKDALDKSGPVKVSTPQQAKSLPRGTRIILPDGTEGRVP